MNMFKIFNGTLPKLRLKCVKPSIAKSTSSLKGGRDIRDMSQNGTCFGRTLPSGKLT